MTIKDLIEQLKTYPQEANVLVFVEGKLYPVLEIDYLDKDSKAIQIGCGWKELHGNEIEDIILKNKGTRSQNDF